MSITLKGILLLIGILALLGSIMWLVKEGGWEPKVAILGTLSTVIVLAFNMSNNDTITPTVEIETNSNSPITGNVGTQNIYYGSEGNKKPNDLQTFKIVDYKNEFDLFTITLLNNTENSQYLKESNLIISNRQLLKHQIIPMNTHPLNNEIILVNVLLNKDLYQFSPEVYIEPKQAENMRFRLHRPHEHNNYEFIEIEFEFVTQDNQRIKTVKLIDFIGHVDMPLANVEGSSPSYNEVINYNKAIIESVKNSSLQKSKRAASFINTCEKAYHN